MSSFDVQESVQTLGPTTSNLADILERVLDKGIVIAGDIKIDLLDIELLTIRLRLFVASVDTARKAGIDCTTTTSPNATASGTVTARALPPNSSTSG